MEAERMDDTETLPTRQELGMPKVRAWHDWRWVAATAAFLASIGIVAFALSAVDNGRIIEELHKQTGQLEAQADRLESNQDGIDELLQDSNINEQRTLTDISNLQSQLRAASSQINGLVAQLNELGVQPRIQPTPSPTPSSRPRAGSTTTTTTTTADTPGRSDPPGQDGKIKKKGS